MADGAVETFTIMSHSVLSERLRKGVWLMCGPMNTGKTVFLRGLTASLPEVRFASTFDEATESGEPVAHLVVDAGIPLKAAEWTSLVRTLKHVKEGTSTSYQSIIFICNDFKSVPPTVRCLLSGVLMMRNVWEPLVNAVFKACATTKAAKVADLIESFNTLPPFSCAFFDLASMTGEGPTHFVLDPVPYTA